MPRHTSRLSGHPSILDAVINYRGARRSGIISGISLSGQRRGFIEDGLSNPSIPDGGIDLFSRNGYLLWGVSSSPGNVKLKLSFGGKSGKRSKRAVEASVQDIPLRSWKELILKKNIEQGNFSF